ncbi:MAG: nucleotidyltransferase domain-containing protein [Mariprofundaceae bacterium]|nr:nucleotidyltransferase domain-containing protein [Mariprofundaceae bacterium]
MKKGKFGLGAPIVAAICDVFAAYPEVDEVILYGSRAKGNYKVGSDIDLSMKGERLDFALLSSINQQLYDLPIPYMVDLSILASISNSNLVEHIQRVGQVFYRQGE